MEVDELGTACSGKIGGDRGDRGSECGGAWYSMLWGDRWR